MTQMVKNLPAMWETWVQALHWEDPLEEGMATHSSILPGESHGQAGYSPWGSKESDTNEQLNIAVNKTKSGLKSPLISNLINSEKFSQGKVKVKLLSHVQLFETPSTVAHQAPQSMEFSRQEYWSGLPFPSPDNQGKHDNIPEAGLLSR